MESILSAVRLRQIILRFSTQLSDRAIARDLHIGRHQLRRLRVALNHTQEGYEGLLALDDAQLLAIVQKAAYEVTDANRHDDNAGDHRKEWLLSQINYYREELRRPGVTLHVLWQEYCLKQTNPYGYSFFCRVVKEHMGQKDPSYVRHYSPGEVLMIDFAGDRLAYVDPQDGEVHEVWTLVCTMGYSKYTYVEILPNASTGELIKGLNNCLSYLGGVPRMALSDNMAQWVTKPHRYEPLFSSAVDQWANHNGLLLTATRPARPKDKAQIENHVKIIYRRIYAPLRDRVFHSLEQLNRAVWVCLEEHNKMNFQSRTYSRHDQFHTDERHVLSPLPTSQFVLRHYATAKVQQNYHVYIGEDKHYYSVPFNLLAERVEIIYDTDTVEIYHRLSRVATHPRDYRPGGYSTNVDHMPEFHLAIEKEIKETGDELLRRASGYGPDTREYVELMLKSRSHPTHAYKPVQGILHLGSVFKYGPQRLERACKLALTLKSYSYKIIESILKNNQDVIQVAESGIENEANKIINHENLRGAETFKKKLP